MQRLQMRLPGSNGNRVLISGIATPDTLRAEWTGHMKQWETKELTSVAEGWGGAREGGRGSGRKRRKTRGEVD